ncbi:hypothetical protein [Cohnella abietis]|uniref:hypothetical protein n=1 Tax=Cohnella abietis TaxID=2507935 RepID=UPI0011AE3FD0|nr:hypothetical protein [Cohnella abietis]
MTMLLTGLAGVLATVAVIVTIRTMLSSSIGKVLAMVVMAVGATLGVTVDTIALSSGVTAMTAASFGIVCGASLVIVCNNALHKRIKKAKLERHF